MLVNGFTKNYIFNCFEFGTCFLRSMLYTRRRRFCLIINYIVVYNFCCSVADVIYSTNPNVDPVTCILTCIFAKICAKTRQFALKTQKKKPLKTSKNGVLMRFFCLWTTKKIFMLFCVWLWTLAKNEKSSAKRIPLLLHYSLLLIT